MSNDEQRSKERILMNVEDFAFTLGLLSGSMEWKARSLVSHIFVTLQNR